MHEHRRNYSLGNSERKRKNIKDIVVASSTGDVLKLLKMKKIYIL